ncbi:MAG: transcriptional regulator [Planctomycetaceae bacterium]|nr:transcriptional regulator [Planctomycetaceae bacterium]
MSSDTERDLWVGFDLGGTKMLAAIYDSDFNVLGKKRKRTRGHEGAQVGLDRIALTINRACEVADVDPKRIRAIGIGAPGPINFDSGVILEAPNLGWVDVPIRDYLESEFGCPVFPGNDVDMGLYGEYRFGAARGKQCCLGIFPGTGIGGACVYEGRIVRGARQSAMEFGHLPIPSESLLTTTTERGGCLEMVAGRLAIAGACAQAAFRGDAPNLVKEAGTDISNIRSGAIAKAIEDGDAAIERIVRDAARHIGRAAGGVIHLLAPQVIVLGGGMVEALPSIFTEEVKQAARDFVLPSFKDSFEVVVAELEDDAVVRGASAWAVEELADK